MYNERLRFLGKLQSAQNVDLQKNQIFCFVDFWNLAAYIFNFYRSYDVLSQKQKRRGISVQYVNRVKTVKSYDIEPKVAKMILFSNFFKLEQKLFG